MPPHLHPRSRLTSSLFATTLFFSFFVVALPHVLPCPAPKTAYADELTDGTKRRRRRKVVPAAATEEGDVKAEQMGKYVRVEELDDEVEERGKRECPVPKPRGFVGSLLGFGEKGEEVKKGGRPP